MMDKVVVVVEREVREKRERALSRKYEATTGKFMI